MTVTPADNAIITVADYASLFGTIDAALENRIQTLINRASGRIELYVGRTLASKSYAGATALILDGTGRNKIVSPHYPVTAVAHLYLDGSRTFGSDTEVDPSDYTLDGPAGLIKLHGTYRTPPGFGTVRLECTAGYLATSKEWQVLQEACSELVKWMAGRGGPTGGIGMKSTIDTNGVGQSWETSLPLDIQDMLEPFRERL
jgi:hypothetical protein